MSRKGGNPDIAEIGASTQFTAGPDGTGKRANDKSIDVRQRKKEMQDQITKALFQKATEAETEITSRRLNIDREEVTNLMAMVGSVKEAVMSTGNAKGFESILKAAGLWTEAHEVTGADGKPLVPVADIDLENLTEEQLALLQQIGEKAINDTSC